MQLKLKPADTFFFRNHRDLETGKGAFLKGIFPPRLSTMYGALRSAYIYETSNFDDFQHGRHEIVKKWMGTPDEFGAFHVQGFFIHDGKQAILPLPLDHQVVQHDNREMAERLLLQQNDVPTSNNANYLLFGPKKEKSASASDAYVDASRWKQALLQSERVEVARASKWIQMDPKIGIALNYQERKAQDSMLYNLEMLRFKEQYADAGFIVSLHHAPSFETVHHAKFGGLGRPWSIETTSEEVLPISAQEKEIIMQQLKETGIARIVFLTDTIWQHGNRPANLNQRTNELQFDDVTVEFLTIATKRPVVIGGWDMVRNRPKQRKNALAAGTVVYVKVQQQDVEKFVNKMMHGQWTDEAKEEGYGWVVCGAAILQ